MDVALFARVTDRMSFNFSTFSFPSSAYARLSGGTSQQLADIELSPFGLHWPQLDEDLAIRALRREHEGEEAAKNSRGRV